MNKVRNQFLLYLFASIAVVYPAIIQIKNSVWALDSTLTLNLFPLFGLIAFSLLWLHAISGVFEPWLRKQINFDNFVNRTSTLILICLTLHPLLLLVNFEFNLNSILFSYEIKYIRLAIAGWVLLIIYDVSKPFKNRAFFSRNWNKILIISTIGFLMTFFHSLALGSDLQSGMLRAVWIFYGATTILSTFYTYGIRRFI